MERASHNAALLREYLSEADVPCPGCGYNLRGLAAEACPECNQALVLRVGLAEPRIGLLITAIVGLAVGVGGALPYVTVFAIESIDTGNWEPGLIALIGGLVVEGIALVLLSRRRGRLWFRQLGARRAAAIAGVTWVPPLVWLMLILAWLFR